MASLPSASQGLDSGPPGYRENREPSHLADVSQTADLIAEFEGSSQPFLVLSPTTNPAKLLK